METWRGTTLEACRVRAELQARTWVGGLSGTRGGTSSATSLSAAQTAFVRASVQLVRCVQIREVLFLREHETRNMKGLSWDQATGQKSEEGSVNELGTCGRQRGTRESLEGGRGTQGGREGGRRKVFLNELEPVGSCPSQSWCGREGPGAAPGGGPPGPRSARAKGGPQVVPTNDAPKCSFPKHGSHKVSNRPHHHPFEGFY